jgi:DNA mismatch repair protein PMS1
MVFASVLEPAILSIMEFFQHHSEESHIYLSGFFPKDDPDHSSTSFANCKRHFIFINMSKDILLILF